MPSSKLKMGVVQLEMDLGPAHQKFGPWDGHWWLGQHLAIIPPIKEPAPCPCGTDHDRGVK